MQKCLLFVFKRSYICYYIISMTDPLNFNKQAVFNYRDFRKRLVLSVCFLLDLLTDYLISKANDFY